MAGKTVAGKAGGKGAGKRGKPAPAAQSSTMTSFFAKHEGVWQPKEEDLAAPEAAAPARKKARLRACKRAEEEASLLTRP